VSHAPPVRIGELARRAGIPAATLRAWERRYGIVEPRRTEGGYRLYSEEDERRLRAMVELIGQGVAPAEAAARVTAAAPAGRVEPAGGAPSVNAPELRAALLDALSSFDEVEANRTLDLALAVYSTEGLLSEIILPALRETGNRWSAGELTVGEEHFTSNLIRGRLLAIARGWGGGEGPLALLACPPGEEHDIGLVCFGLILRELGWRITFLGADTPFESLTEATRRTHPELVVLAITSPETAARLSADGRLDLPAPVLVAGALAGPELAARLGAELLDEDIVAAAGEIAERAR
jgi:DNA-binding transcriptional MerR regulator